MPKTKVRWDAKKTPRRCLMHECKANSMEGGSWCYEHLLSNLESARKLLKTWRVLNVRQSRIVMSKINKIVEALRSGELERQVLASEGADDVDRS
jgi:hypothetical protein